jgi:hypothetical protein
MLGKLEQRLNDAREDEQIRKQVSNEKRQARIIAAKMEGTFGVTEWKGRGSVPVVATKPQ